METVTVSLTTAWPTDRGVLRPVEGPVPVSVDEAIKIVDAGCGEIADRAGRKLVAAAKSAARKEAAEKEAAEKLAAEQAAAEKEAAEKAAAESAKS